MTTKENNQSLYSYLMIESPGIQSYITSTGKLREMIGGSQIISELTSVFFDSVINEMGLEESSEPGDGSKWYLVVQQAAATIRIVLPDENIARSLLKTYSLAARKRYPGLQILGAIVPMNWDASSYEHLREAGQKASQKLGEKRVKYSSISGLSLLPFCQAASLDAEPGIPQKDKDKNEVLSQASATRDYFAELGNENLTNRFNIELQDAIKKEFKTEKEVKLKWALNYEDMFHHQVSHSYLGILHMDGNDLGKIIENKLESHDSASTSSINKKMRDFSSNLDDWNQNAFQLALNTVVLADLKKSAEKQQAGLPDEYFIPVRPLVIGGDDLTVAVRADLALQFAAVYADAITGESGTENITVGAGMVICNHHYPFTRAYSLVEELTSSAKAYCKKQGNLSGIDFLVLTSEMEDKLDTIRKRLYTGSGKETLTRKPYGLNQKEIEKFNEKVSNLHNKLPVSAIRRAVDACRLGKEHADKYHLEMLENIRRELGGRHNQKLMEESVFTEMFAPGSYFSQDVSTDLLDLYEMTRFTQGDL